MPEPLVPALACPHCGAELVTEGAALRCENGHSFDFAKQGYVSLLAAASGTHTADTAEMIEARARFLAGGHFLPIAAAAVAELSEPVLPQAGCLVDLGAGTGYYLSRALGRLPGRFGLALDNSKYAARRSARSHERAGAVVCDTWHGLPLRDRAAAAVLNVFAPRNGSEIERVLAPGGRLVAITPTERHLVELVERLDLITVDGRKRERLRRGLGASMEIVRERELDWPMGLSHEQVISLVGMGPSGRRRLRGPELAETVTSLPEPLEVTGSIRITTSVRG